MAHLLSPEDEKRVAEAVAAAERATAGEIVVTIAARSSEYARQRLAASFFVTLAVAVAVHEVVPTLDSFWILCGQAPVLMLVWWLTGHPVCVRWLTSDEVRREVVSARAKQLFVEQGVTETRDRSGVLLYLSEAEHRLELLADRGIHERVGAERWQGVVEEVVGAIRKGQAAEGIRRAVAVIGQSLAEHFPAREDDVNELSDAPRRV